MKTVQQIIDMRGGLNQLANEPIKLEVPGFVPLAIEWFGAGPDGSEMVSVMHYFIQNGDLMRDSDIVFAVKGDIWFPWSYRQHSIRLYQEAKFRDEQGNYLIRPRLLKESQKFAKVWDPNLADQGSEVHYESPNQPD